MAESMTPAWLMPTQNTKLTSRKPHITGRLMPYTPVPWLMAHAKPPIAAQMPMARPPMRK